MTRQQLEDFRAAAKAVREKYCNTPEQALQFLQEAGVVDANGELTEYYRSSRA